MNECIGFPVKGQTIFTLPFLVPMITASVSGSKIQHKTFEGAGLVINACNRKVTSRFSLSMVKAQSETVLSTPPIRFLTDRQNYR